MHTKESLTQKATCAENGLYIKQDGKNEPLFVPDCAFLRLYQVLQIIPVSRSTWWLQVAQGNFPKGIKLAPNMTAWKVSDIRMLIEKLVGEMEA